MPFIRPLASGTLVEVDDSGLASFLKCDWQYEVPSGNPEPDSPEDCWTTVTCDQRLRVHPDYADGMICEDGHERLPVHVDLAPGGPAWQREAIERFAHRDRF